MFELEDEKSTPTRVAESPKPIVNGRRAPGRVAPPPPSPVWGGWHWLRPVARASFVALLALYVWGRWQGSTLPDRKQIHPLLLKSPLQEATERVPFDFEYRGSTYTVEPVAEYDIRGLVVSHNNTSGWGDIYHDEDSVDFKDLCLIWGPNVIDNLFHQVTFWSEAWTCNFRTTDSKAGESFDGRALSNNHLLTNDPEVQRTIEAARVGDQIIMRGMLVNYYPKDLRPHIRRTSIVRTDEGDGACEVLFVEEANLLRRGPRLGYYLREVGFWGLLGAILLNIGLLLFLPLHLYRRNN